MSDPQATTTAEATAPYASSPTPNGIAGWLVLPAIGLVITPFLLLRNIGDNLSVLPELRGLPANVYAFVWADIAANAALLVFGLYTAVRFFGRRINAPTLMIFWLILAVALGWLETFAIIALTNGSGAAEGGRATAQTITTALWVTYFVRSRRVQNTFTR